ncbi:MAG: hypothetical protein M3299_12985 [Thermoproteota archaeon]|nr:hypothetical protein [Thermoproteota archaeon]
MALRAQMIIRTSIVVGVFAALALGVFSSFQLSASSLTNQVNATTNMPSLPVADIPFYRERITVTGQNPINATHIEVSLSGNGNLTLPNSTQTIAVNSTGSALVNFDTTSVIAQEFLTTQDGTENASATIYEITRHDVQTRTEKGVVTAIFETNSTIGQLSFLDGMIAVGLADVDAAGNTDITLWEFETGIPYEKNWMELLMSVQE